MICGGKMDKKILVAYATKHGATFEIAERIGKKLEENNLKVEILPAKQVKDLTGYAAVIIGSGVYIGQWIKDAGKFLHANETVLKTLPVWIFSSGPTGEGDASELVKGWKLPRGVQESVDVILPKGVVVFHGALDEKKLSRLERWMIGKVGAALGDFRDWEKIDQWANEIGTQLKE
jgi:menaquinone-dependent protoporphyrinogen oxidase